jgi:hypothetical protein
MTRTHRALALSLLMVSWASSALAGGALIEVTAPLADRTEDSVKIAVMTAIDKAVRGAAAMGFAWFELRDAQLSGDEVAVQILATDDEPDPVEEIDPGGGPDEPRDDGGLTEEPGLEPPIDPASRLHI